MCSIGFTEIFFNRLKRISKKHYFAKYFQTYDKDIRMTWKSIRILLGICYTFYINNEYISDNHNHAGAT